MKLNDIDWTLEHNEICSGCGKRYKIVTKEPEESVDSIPIFIKCDSCDDYVRFDVGVI